MREIKFRGWQDGQMVVSPISSNYGLTRFFGFLYEDAPIMQFTGLTDKNGREIYEGDVLKGGVHKSWIVRWDGLQAEWNIGLTVQHYYEVIGNIHENPELL